MISDYKCNDDDDDDDECDDDDRDSWIGWRKLYHYRCGKVDHVFVLFWLKLPFLPAHELYIETLFSNDPTAKYWHTRNSANAYH